MQKELTLLTAAFLHVPSRRLRALARNQDPALEEWLHADPARRLAHARHLAREAEQQLERLRAQLVTIEDDSYPPGLRDLHDPPPFLFVRGSLSRGGLAIVGSRTPPEAAKVFAREFAASCGKPVISGLATGIDAAAHRGALDGGLPTMAYVGTGLGVTYPPEHRTLEEEIVASTGAIATERLPGETVTKWSLAHRDRLQAAHANAIVLIASEIDGGAMIAMQAAKNLGRPRFALTGDADARYDGNRAAIADGAIALPFDVERALKRIHHILSDTGMSARTINLIKK